MRKAYDRAAKTFKSSRLSENPKFTKLGLVAFVIIFGAIGYQIFFSSAAPVPVKPVTSTDATFQANVVLLKLTPTGKDKVKAKGAKPSPIDTGIARLDKLNEARAGYKLEPIAVPGKNSDPDAPLFRWYRLTLLNESQTKINPKKDKAEFAQYKKLLKQYKAVPEVQEAEPDLYISTTSVPNDPYFSSSRSWGQSYDDMYGLKKLNMASAWDQTTGSSSIIVADIDTGVDRNHEDLAGQMWVNNAEIPNNGKDDDGNGYIDDYYGCNFNNMTTTGGIPVCGDPLDNHGHGTHTVGTIAGVGNNGKGVSGINWTSKIMALKFLDANGTGYLTDGARGLQYAADMGARVSSNSWGAASCTLGSQMLDDAIKYEHDKGMVTVVAAGNSTSDALDFCPANSDYALTVSASDYNDNLASFSNFGSRIDVAAPGVDILSLRASGTDMYHTGAQFVPSGDVNAKYYRASGTSMATPHVAGLAALLLAKNPSLNPDQVRQIIRTSSIDLGSQGKDSSFGFGRIDAAKTVTNAASQVLTPVISSPGSRTTLTGSAVTVSGSIGGSNFASYKLELGTGRAPSSWTTLTTSTTQPTAGTTLATINSASFPDGTYTLRLTATDTSNNSFQYQVFDLNFVNFSASISYPSLYVPKSQISVLGTAVTLGSNPFVSYKLEYGSGASPTSWTTISTGTQPVNNGVLGNWDTTSLSNNAPYSLRLSVFTSSNISTSTTTTLTVDNTITSGWPLHLDAWKSCSGNGSNNWGAGDIDGDGKKDVVMATQVDSDTGNLNQLFAFSSKGALLSGFPITLSTSIPEPSSIQGCSGNMLLADLDNDGRQEILLPFGYGPIHSKLLIYKGNGQPYTGWNSSTLQAGNAGWNDPISVLFTDINADGKKDIVELVRGYTLNRTTSQYEGPVLQLHVFDLVGNELAGFPKNATYNFPITDTSDLSVVDLDNDGKYEFAFGQDDKIYLLNDQLQLLPGWPYQLPPATTAGAIRMVNRFTTFAAADFYGNGQKELFAFTGNECMVSGGSGSVRFVSCASNYAYGVTYGLQKNGSLLAGWPKVATSEAYGLDDTKTSSLLVGDIDGDGSDDVVLPSDPQTIYTKNGKLQAPANACSWTKTAALADVNGDNKLDLVGFGCVYDFATSSVLWQRNDLLSIARPIVADLDNDGRLEMIQSFGLNEAGQSMGVWKLDFGKASHYDWPMYGQNQFHNENIYTNSRTPVTPPPPSPPPPTGDTQAPTVSVTAPTNNSTVSATVNMTATATDNVGVTKVDFMVDNSLISSDTSSPYSASWDSTKVGNGSHLIVAKAYDAVGNASTSTVTVNVSNGDSQPPTVNVTAPTNGSTVSGSVSMTASSSDNIGVTKVDFLVDGTFVSSDPSPSYNSSWDSTTVSNGTHSITAKAYDAAGNSATSTVTVNVSNGDTAPPSTPTGLATNAPAYNQVNLSWNASTDNVGVAGYYIVRGGVTIAQTTGTGTSYSDSSVNASTNYSYQVMAYDARGNVSNLSTASTVKTPAVPDTSAPTAPTNLTAMAVSASQINLTWSASTDNVGVSVYDVYRNNTKIATVASTSFGDTGLSASTTYSYFVKARDVAGNTSQVSNTASAKTSSPPTNLGSLSGTATSSKGGPAVGVTVAFKAGSTKYIMTTNSSGQFSASSLTPSSTLVKFDSNNYRDYNVTVKIVAGSTTTVNATLKAK